MSNYPHFSRVVLIAGIATGLSAAGCAAPQPTTDCDFELKKSQTHLDETQRMLTQEQARSAGLVEELGRRSQDLSAARADAATLKERLSELSHTNDGLRKLLDERIGSPLDAPIAPPSPVSAIVDERLAKFANGSGGRVTYLRARGAVSFANDRLFDSGSDAVRVESFPLLKELAEILNLTSPDEYDVIIVGHTDSQPIVGESVLGKHPSNWYLSVHRAIAVKDLLLKSGLPQSRIGVMGYADQRPAGADPARNRRVEVFIALRGTVQPTAGAKSR